MLSKMKLSLLVVVSAFLFASAGAAAAPIVSEYLTEVVAAGDTGEYFVVTIHMERQVTDAEKSLIPWDQDKNVRRADFVNLYKSVAESSQAGLLAYLEDSQIEGKVGFIHPHWITNTVVAEMYPSVVETLMERADIDALGISEEAEGSLICGEPTGATGGKSTAWGVTHVEADIVWETPYNYTGEDIVVAVADTGCRYTHHDMRDHLWVNEDEIPDNSTDDDSNGYIDDTLGWDFEMGQDDNDPSDGSGHGTHTSGTNTSDGTAGNACGMAPDASLMVIRVPNQIVSGAEDKYWEAFEYITENGADVLSMSMGFLKSWTTDAEAWSWRDATINMVDGGVVCSIAAGNEGGGSVPYNLRYPGCVPEIISVGATDSNDNIAGFSSRGPVEWDVAPPYNDYPYPPGLTKPDVCAPGVDVFSTVRTSDTSYQGGWSGTSMATPHVGGMLALMVEARPDLTPVQLKQYLEANALDLGTGGKDNNYGSGRIQALDTIQALNANPHPDHFSILTPGHEATEETGDVEFTWESTTDPGKKSIASYTLRISEEPNFRTYDDYTGITDTGTIVDMKYEGTFYWKVKALDDEGAYTWCNQRRFVLIIEPGSGTDEPDDGNVPYVFNLAQNRPNPVTGATTFAFAIPETANVTLELFDVKGRKVDTLVNETMDAGEYEVNYASAIPMGVYLYRLNAGSDTAIKKMVVTTR
ncbi:MAG: S8 family serine peptidase [bacterium]|nr:S8 family serine peptidase [bacterium]